MEPPMVTVPRLLLRPPATVCLPRIASQGSYLDLQNSANPTTCPQAVDQGTTGAATVQLLGFEDVPTRDENALVKVRDCLPAAH
jgi:hypothetical protein